MKAQPEATTRALAEAEKKNMFAIHLKVRRLVVEVVVLLLLLVVVVVVLLLLVPVVVRVAVVVLVLVVVVVLVLVLLVIMLPPPPPPPPPLTSCSDGKEGRLDLRGRGAGGQARRARCLRHAARGRPLRGRLGGWAP